MKIVYFRPLRLSSLSIPSFGLRMSPSERGQNMNSVVCFSILNKLGTFNCRFIKLVASVRESGGDVKIFSSLHISGERKFSASVKALT